MNKITVNDKQYTETTEIYPISEGLFFNSKWYVPIKEYKVGDWVLFVSEEKGINEVRRVISGDEINPRQDSPLTDSFGSWMTVEATNEYSDCVRLANNLEILNHLTKLSINKGFVKGVTIEDNNGIKKVFQCSSGYYNSFNDWLMKGKDIIYEKGDWAKIVLDEYHLKNGDLYIGQYYTTEYKDQGKYTFKYCSKLWIHHLSNEVNTLDNGNFTYSNGFENFRLANKEEIEMLTPKFTFGEESVYFNESNHLGKKVINIVCKDTTGTNEELSEILKSYFRPCSFGSQSVKGFTFKDKSIKGDIVSRLSHTDVEYIDTVTIGCLTGTYKELLNIYNHSLTLLVSTT